MLHVASRRVPLVELVSTITRSATAQTYLPLVTPFLSVFDKHPYVVGCGFPVICTTMLAMVTARLWQNEGPDFITSIHLLYTGWASFLVGLATRIIGYYRTDTLAGIALSV